MVWTDELTGAVEQENFLLDKGRLKLKAVKQAFNASLVRMTIGKMEIIAVWGTARNCCEHVVFLCVKRWLNEATMWRQKSVSELHRRHVL